VVRRPHPSEAPAIADLLNAEARARYGESELTAKTIEEWFGFDDIEIRVVDEGGELLAYGDLGRDEVGTRAWLDVREHPGRPGAAEPLWDELEAIAGAGISARAVIDSGDDSLRGQLEARGYRIHRSSYRMLIDLDGPVPGTNVPDGITIRAMRPGEERLAHETHTASFADHFEFQPESYERWAQFMVETSGYDPELWFVAEADGAVAGISLCRMHDSGDPRHGWVSILGVLPAFRRRGLGAALLRHTFAVFAARGGTRVSLGVDAESTTGAVRLYERVGMREVRRTDTWEKAL